MATDLNLLIEEMEANGDHELIPELIRMKEEEENKNKIKNPPPPENPNLSGPRIDLVENKDQEVDITQLMVQDFYNSINSFNNSVKNGDIILKPPVIKDENELTTKTKEITINDTPVILERDEEIGNHKTVTPVVIGSEEDKAIIKLNENRKTIKNLRNDYINDGNINVKTVYDQNSQSDIVIPDFSDTEAIQKMNDDLLYKYLNNSSDFENIKNNILKEKQSDLNKQQEEIKARLSKKYDLENLESRLLEKFDVKSLQENMWNEITTRLQSSIIEKQKAIEESVMTSLINDVENGKYEGYDQGGLQNVYQKLVEEAMKPILDETNKMANDELSKYMDSVLEEVNAEYGDILNKANNELQKEFHSAQWGEIINDPRFQSLTSEFYDELNYLNLQDENDYIVDKNTWGLFKDAQKTYDKIGLYNVPVLNMLSPFQVYNGGRKLITSLQSTYTASKIKLDYNLRYDRLMKNLSLSQKENWNDEDVGYVNSNGDFIKWGDNEREKFGVAFPWQIKRMGNFPYADYKKEAKWGESRDAMQIVVDQNNKNIAIDFAKIFERRGVENAYDKGDMHKIMSGNFSLKDVSLMVSDQAVNIVTAIGSFGMIPAVQEGAGVYEQLIQDAAREKFGLRPDQQPSIAQLLEVANDNALHDLITSKSQLSGIIMGSLEYIGANQLVKPFFKNLNVGVASLIRGQYKRMLQSGVAMVGQSASGSFTEAITEGLQTAVSSAATGNWSSEEFLQAIGQGAIVGFALPFGGNVVAQSARELSSIYRITSGKLNKESAEAYFNGQLKELENSFKNGKIKKKDYEEKLEIITNLRNANTKIPREFKGKQKEKVINLLIRKEELNKKIEGKDNKLTKKEQDELSVINEQLMTESDKEKAQKNLDRNIEATKTLAEKLNLIVNTIKKEQGGPTTVQELYNEWVAQDPKNRQAQDVTKSDGFLMGDKVIINYEVAKRTAAVSVGTHEILHAILRSTLNDENGNITQDGIDLVDGFLDQLFIADIDAYNKIEQRINNNYKYNRNKNGQIISEKSIDQYYEEYFNVFHDLIVKGKIKSGQENLLQRIGGVFTNLFRKKGFEKIKFQDANKGKDVFDFLVNYSKDVKRAMKGKGSVRQEIIDLATKGKKADIRVTKIGGVSFSKTASENVQQIYDTQGEAGIAGILSEYKPMVSNIVNKYKDVPGFDRQLLIDEIETGKRGIYDLVREYNPESGVPLAAFINKYLRARAIEAAQRVLKTDFEVDITEQKTIAAEVTEEADVKRKPRKKKVVLAERLGINDKVSKAIKKIVPDLNFDKLTFKTLNNKIPEIVGELFGISSKKIISGANITKKELQSSQMFISKNADLLINMLPEGATASGTATGVPKTLLKAFYTKTERAKAAKTGSKAGLPIQVKKDISRKDFLETFGIIDGKPVRTDRNTSARVLALANTLGKMITNQAVRQEIGEKNIKAKEVVSRIKDGKSSVMFSNSFWGNLEIDPAIFEAIYGYPIGDLGSAHGYSRVPNKKDKTRDLDAMFNKTETFRDAGVRVINTFLESHPEFRQLIRITTTGGKKAGFFQFVNIFDQLINEIDIDERYIPRTKYGGEGAVYSKNFHKKLKEGKFDKLNAERLPLLYDFFKAVEAHLQNYPEDVWMFEEILLDTGKGQNVFTRILAPFAFYPINPDTSKPIFNQAIKEEHTDPQNLIGKALLAGAMFGKVDEVWKVVGKSYMQGAILDSKKHGHDKIIEEAGYGRSMPDIYYKGVVPRLLDGSLVLPDGYASIVRLAAAVSKKGERIDLNMYKLYKEDMAITEFFKVDGIKNPDGSNNIELQNETIIRQLTGEVAPGYGESISKVPFSKSINEGKTLSKAIMFSRSSENLTKGITVLDFDDTLATTESLVKYTTPEGETGTLNAEQYASTYEDLLDQGYTFDFSDFNKVVKGKLAPLFNKAMKLQSKFGPKNMFVLTARPPAAQKPIYDFLKANGLNIPLENITGLGNSTSEAKALWIANKVGEGYNDFYFADDALQNVQAVKNMLDQFDVKSKVQQAKVKFSNSLDPEFNDILEETTGMQSEKEFSTAKAKLRGKGKGRFDFFIPPSAEDFKGLLYRFLAKGKKGEQQMAWFKKALLDPFARGYRELNEAKQSMWNDYNALRKAMPDVRKKLTKIIEGQKDFRYSDAVRVYLWDKAGYTIPGLSQTDLTKLTDVVNNDPELQAYADTLGLISKRPEGYVEPSQEWLVGNIMSDLEGANKVNRADFLAEWIENKDIIFSQKNLNKIEALYGANFVEALKDMLYRMEKGTNRTTGDNRLVNAFQNWINNSVGAIMFFNARSAVLQTLSTVNFINWGDNNIAKAAIAFANQKQFWKDFTFLFNSDMLKQRRKGLKTDVNTAELTEAVGRSKNPVMAALNYLLQKGFLPTQIADSFAISSGGATFYRNRVNTYLKEGLSQKEAEIKAFEDFQEIAEETQQSSRPDLISQQQASTLGRLILAFQNTPMQYMRLTKKAMSDLVNGRGDWKTNVSRILYYGFVQNVIFFSLQSALFALAFDDDEEDEKRAKTEEKKMQRLYNGILDSILRGTGVGGAVVSTIKNMIIKFAEEEGKGWNKDFDNVVIEGLQLSPPIGSKVRKLRSAGRSWSYNRDVIKKMNFFDIDNPVWDAIGNVVSAFTNAPMDRLVNKTKNIREALNEDNATWQRIALMLGWNRWDLNIKSDKIELVKTIVKEEKKQKAKEKREAKKKEEEAVKQLEIDNTIKKEIEEEKEAEKKGEKKKEYTCVNVNSKGKRCNIVVPKAGMRCTIHEKVEQRTDGKKSQCKKIKSDGKRCRMQTSNKSGLCYYHD